MERRFVDALEFRFDQVEDRGFAEITGDELLRWYGRQRIGKGVWEDIKERWAERTDEPLLVTETGKAYLFVWGQGLTCKDDDDAWLRPIDDFVRRAA